MCKFHFRNKGKKCEIETESRHVTSFQWSTNMSTNQGDGFNSVANTCQTGNIFRNVQKVNMTNILVTNTYRLDAVLQDPNTKKLRGFTQKTTYKKHMHAVWLQILWPSCPLSKHWVSLHEMMNAKRYLYPSHHQTSRQTIHGNVRGRPPPNVTLLPGNSRPF